MILIYLSIGPCLAIPRTASTSFAMLTPLLGSSAGLQLGYSVLFFGAAFLVALRPDRLTRWLGRLLCPLPAGSDFDPVRRLFATPAGGAVRCAHRCV